LHAFGVGEEWAPSRTSAQQAADRLARYGTSMPGVASNDPIWVGAPLRVHRRCDQPMFDISNTIAYDGLMVFGKPEGKPFHGHSVWCDIRSSVSEGHWIPAEGKTLHLVLTRLREAALPVGEIRVISPFRQVVSGAMRIHQAVFPETAAGDRKKWVGTVHTMQGKEADVVILILGGNPDRPGSRQFATDTPNLLNVAVTRARRRLYVIGNQETWGREQYFGELANRIPVWEP
jgi:superfamily I DNA and/or RNA helicase